MRALFCFSLLIMCLSTMATKCDPEEHAVSTGTKGDPGNKSTSGVEDVCLALDDELQPVVFEAKPANVPGFIGVIKLPGYTVDMSSLYHHQNLEKLPREAVKPIRLFQRGILVALDELYRNSEHMKNDEVYKRRFLEDWMPIDACWDMREFLKGENKKFVYEIVIDTYSHILRLQFPSNADAKYVDGVKTTLESFLGRQSDDIYDSYNPLPSPLGNRMHGYRYLFGKLLRLNVEILFIRNKF